MTTQINITVDSGGLADRAKQQQQAARQAQLEKERQQRIEVEATDKRIAAQVARGLSLDGQPLYGTGFTQPQVERRPAAFRSGGYEVATAFIRFASSTQASVSQPTFDIQPADKSVTVSVYNANPTSPPIATRYRTQTVTLVGKPRYWNVTNTSDPNYIPLPISWTGTITGEITNFSQSRATYSNPRIIAMPAGGKNMILYINDQVIDCFCQANWSATGSASVYLDTSTNTRKLNRTQTITPETNQQTTTTYVVEYCWIIGPGSIRAISVPATFKSIVKSLVPDLIANPTYTPDATSPESSFWLEASQYPESGTYNFWASQYHFWGLYLANNSTDPSPRFFISSAWFDNVYTWGMASDNDIDYNTGSGTAIWTTPAIFEMLRKPAEIRDAYENATGDPYNYQHVADTLLVDISTPSKFLGFKRQDDNLARFDIAGVLPLNYYDYSNAEPLKVNAKGKVPVLTPAENYTNLNMVYCWDWGNPTYCKNQLKSMGFTDADLVP